MDYATELYKILSLYFTGNKARLVCMTNILIGMIKASTTNMHKVSNSMPGAIKFKSKYRRLQRFFEQITLDWDHLANYIIGQISFASKVILIIDRTNWKFGNVNINFLVLSIAWKGISIPIYWFNLARAGNSLTTERMRILSKGVNLLGITRIEALLGDREFIGKDWLNWLSNLDIPFVVRIKNNSKLYKNKKYRKAINSFRSLSRGYIRYVRCELWGLSLTVVGYKPENGNVYILATNGDPNLAVKYYSIRWQTESMFLCLKSNGFNLESTNITEQNKLELLFGLLAILTSWNCKIGSWYNTIKPIKIKNHHRPEQNLFHYGMSIISTIINNVFDYSKDLKNIMEIIREPWSSSIHHKELRLQCV